MITSTVTPGTGSIDKDFWPYAISIGLIALLLAAVDRVSSRAGTLFVIVVLLGVVFANRSGFAAFTAFLQRQTQRLPGFNNSSGGY